MIGVDASDYDEWAKNVGDDRWSYEAVRPWLCKVESWEGDGSRADTSDDTRDHGFEGPMHVASISVSESGHRNYPLREPVKNAWVQVGVSPGRETRGSMAGLTEMHENSRDGLRQPAQVAYPLDKVKVMTNTAAHRITCSVSSDTATATATGVELADGRKVAARKEVIVCAGTYHTPQLLMLSGIGPSATLEEHGITVVCDSEHVGRNLHDHFAIYMAFRLRNPSIGYALGSPAWQNPALFKGLPWDWVVSQPLPDETLTKSGNTKYQGRNLWEALTVYVPPGIPGIPIDGSHIATSTMLLLPTSRGTVSLRSNNPGDTPLIRPSYFSTQLDRDALVYAARQTLKAMLDTASMKPIVECETPPSGLEGLEGLESLTAESSDDDIEERIRRTGTQHHHSGGTAAMGKVVDVEGRVMGVKGLRVADASIVPVPLGGHPQATLYAMAEQLVDFILRDA